MEALPTPRLPSLLAPTPLPRLRLALHRPLPRTAQSLPLPLPDVRTTALHPTRPPSQQRQAASPYRLPSRPRWRSNLRQRAVTPAHLPIPTWVRACRRTPPATGKPPLTCRSRPPVCGTHWRIFAERTCWVRRRYTTCWRRLCPERTTPIWPRFRPRHLVAKRFIKRASTPIPIPSKLSRSNHHRIINSNYVTYTLHNRAVISH